jgi:hypothetical protein
LAGSFHPSQNNKEERGYYEKASFDRIDGRRIGFRARAAF